MFIDIFSEFVDKEVEVSTSAGKTYSGTFRQAPSQNAVIVSPTREYYVKRYGPAYIKDSEVVSIRELYPVIEEDDEKDDDYKTASPKQVYSPTPLNMPLVSHDMGIDDSK